jgi:P-type Ca2+ transporter type 2C
MLATKIQPGTPAHASPQALAAPDVYYAYDTRPAGLTQSEAAARLARYGPNLLQEVKGTPLILKLLANFTHLMALLLWAGGLIGFLAQLPQLGIAIWAVNLINGAFSFWQEYKAERATAALRRLLPAYARVLRDGQEQRIAAEALVPGDVMLLSEGDHISADGRLVYEAELRIDQSTLSGESYAVRKISEVVQRTDLAYTEAPNLVFAGTSVVAGTATAVVVATGMATEFGKIAHLTQSVGEERSPLQQELARVTRTVSILASSIGIAFFVLAIAVADVSLASGFIFAMGMIVAFVPEGMLPTVTLALAMGVQRMAKRHALVKRLSAVETLGCTSVICTDKTGTLTENEMTVCSIWLGGCNLSVSGVGYAPDGRITCGERAVGALMDDLRQLLLVGGLCNDARLLPPEGEGTRWTILGDPTEAALRVVAAKGGVDLEREEQRTPRVRELPFDSRRKRMSTLHRCAGVVARQPSGLVAYVKGAPDEILSRCTAVRWNGQDLQLDDTRRAAIRAANDAYARQGLRVLALALRGATAAPGEYSAESVERDLTFLGLVALMDPPRPEVAAAVERCHRAGIRIVMITGDYGLTAESIARRIGILRRPRPRILGGAELNALDDAALQAALEDEVIFARVAPEHKLRVVSALQAMGQIVAVTGDGVNDAPALKRANIGVAMGVAGTDVAKEAADMILTDDNFASIVSAVEEGRAVYANIRKFAMYVFNSNMAEAMPFVAMLFSRGAIPLPLTVMQVLAIDLGTDMVPAMGLGTERPEAGVMDRPPRSQKERLLTTPLLARALLWYGLIEAVAALAGYFFLNWRYGWPGTPLASEGTLVYQMATTMTLAGIVAAQVGAVFGCRTERNSIVQVGFFTNKLVLIGIAVELLLLGLLVYVPLLQGIFNTAPLSLIDWLVVFTWAPLIFLLDEARKAMLRKRERTTRRHAAPAITRPNPQYEK